MNKRQKITLIILNIIASIGFLFAVWIAYDVFRLKFIGDLSALGLIVLLPSFFFLTLMFLIFAIVLIIMFAKAKKLAVQNQTKLKITESLFSFLPLVFVILALVTILLFFII